MITEDYTSLETAKLLKEKGFDEYCPLWYNLDKPIESPLFYEEIGWYGHNSYSYIGRNIISAPTLQMAMKWLRVVHKLDIDISIEYNPEKVYYYAILKKIAIRDFGCLNSETNFNSYEEACEAAIKFCLENLI